MQIALISFFIFATVILIMSVGVLMGRKPVQGSCGGLSNVDGMTDCEICGGDVKKCDETNNDKSSADNSVVRHYRGNASR